LGHPITNLKHVHRIGSAFLLGDGGARGKTGTIETAERRAGERERREDSETMEKLPSECARRNENSWWDLWKVACGGFVALTDQHATSPGSNFMQGSPVRRQAVQFLTRARITKVERDLAVVAFDPRQGLSVARESNGACVCELRFRSLPASTTN